MANTYNTCAELSRSTYKDSGIAWIGEIPSEWEVVRVKNLYRERTELSETGKERLLSVSEYYGVAPTSEKIEDGEFITRAESLVGYKKCYKNDFVSNIMLAWKGSFGTTDYDGIVSPAYCVYKPVDNISPQFYHYLFRTDLYKSRFKSYSKGIIDSRLRLYSPFFYLVDTILPPENEQITIATFLDSKCSEIDSLISLQEEMISELQAYKQSVITEAVTKGLNPNAKMKESGVEWIGEIPEGWNVCKIKNVFRLSTGTTPKSYEDIVEGEESVNWYTPSDIIDGGNELWNSQRKLSKRVINDEGIKLYPKHSLIYVGIGATAGKVGYSHEEGYSNQQITALIPKGEGSKYFYYLLNAVRVMIRENAYFTTLPIINNSYLGQREIPCPPFSEQQSIATYLDTKTSQIDSLITLKQEKIQELKDYKKSIIYEYVTGKKRVI